MSIIRLTAEKAVKLLCAVNASFIVILADGTRFAAGGLELAPEKPATRRRPLTHPKGSLTEIFRAKLDALAVGDSVVIACPADIGADRIRAAMGSYAGQKWGNGSWTSCSDKVAGTAELLRLG